MQKACHSETSAAALVAGGGIRCLVFSKRD